MHLGESIDSILDGHVLPVLLNTAAGRFTSGYEDAMRDSLARAGARFRLQLVGPASLASVLDALKQNGEPVIAVGGGDGSISTAAAVLAGSRTALLPVPLGTRNHFARRFGLTSLDAVARALHSGSAVCVSLGRVNGHTFVNNASCGYYPHFVRRREQLRPLLSSVPAACTALLVALARRRLMDLELVIDGRTMRRQTAALWIGIGRHSLRLPQPGDATREGDFLEALMPRPGGRTALLALALRVWRQLRAQQELSDPSLELLRSTAFTVRSDLPIDIAIDGEVHAWQGPLHFDYWRDALRVWCLVAPEPS